MKITSACLVLGGDEIRAPELKCSALVPLVLSPDGIAVAVDRMTGCVHAGAAGGM